MAVTGPARAAPAIRRSSGPALIAHGAGNTPAQVQQALEETADFVEVDLFVHRGRFEARHERSMYPLPLWVEKWYLRWAPREPFGLAELLRKATGKAGVFLDLKNGNGSAARLVRQALDDLSGEAGPVVASSQYWYLLRQLRVEAPGVALFYSIDVRAKLDLFLSVSERDVEPVGVSCRHTLIDERTVAELHRRGLEVVAWTIDDPDRAAQLAGWGVDGITTHRVATLRARLGVATA
jgi:glycerophosphoryl diester phosphodiesterase